MASNEHYALQAFTIALYNQSIDDGVFQVETRKLMEFMIEGTWGENNKVTDDFHLHCGINKGSSRTISFIEPAIDKPRILKPSKWIQHLNRQFNFGLEPKAIEYMATTLGEILPAKWGFDFELLRGEGIMHAYNTIIHSCMTNSVTVNFYEDNPDNVGMIKILKDGAAIGRALLWTLEDGSMYLDRIYPNQGAHVEETLKYAQEQGWRVRPTQTADRGRSSAEKIPHTVLLNHPRDDAQHSANSMGPFPYLDTFNYMCHTADKKSVRLSNRLMDGFVPVMSTTKGYRGLFFCELSEGWYDNADKFSGFVHQADGTSRKIVASRKKIKGAIGRVVEIKGELYVSEHPDLVIYNGHPVLRKELIIPAGLNREYHIDECIELGDGNYLPQAVIHNLSYQDGVWRLRE